MFQGRVVEIDSRCNQDDSSNTNKNSIAGSEEAKGHDSNGSHTIGLVSCGSCSLSVLLERAAKSGAKGVIVANSSDCGRPTDDFFEVTSNVDIPVAFVTTRVTNGIRTMQQQAARLKGSQGNGPRDDAVQRDAFVYVSILHSGTRGNSQLLARVFASTHILLASMVMFTLIIYLMLACTVGSLRHIPREIAPELFGTRPEPVDKSVIEQLPLLYVEWTAACAQECGVSDEKDLDGEESRYETPESDFTPSKIENEVLQQQLARIIQRTGRCSYSFTEEDDCAICLGQYAQKDLLRLLPCKHAFHQRCIDTWLQCKDMTVHCPVCKSDINKGLARLKRHGYDRILDLMHRNPDGNAAAADIAAATAIATNTTSDPAKKNSDHILGNTADSQPASEERSALAASFMYFYQAASQPLSELFASSDDSRRTASGGKRAAAFWSRTGNWQRSKTAAVHTNINDYQGRLRAKYDLARRLCLDDPERFSSSHVDKHSQPTSRDIFPNTELQLSRVRTYGFDYDYTLARYTDKLPETIYNMIRDVLVKKLLYPPALLGLKYDKGFAIRGISYDKETGWLFKLDSNYNIAMDTIHYGREPLRDLEEVYSLHNGPHIPPDYVKSQLYHLNDIYSVPEATLLADITQYFTEHSIPFHPRYLAEDIRTAGEYIHRGDGISHSPLHTVIMNNIGDYLNRAPELLDILQTLKKEGKRLFLLTNSGYDYINTGLTYLFNMRDWRDLFDVVIVRARKPGWYLSHRPFRTVPTESSSSGAFSAGSQQQPWAPVDRFEDGQVYMGGNLMSFTNITGYTDRNVMYFGDHIYSDLRDPTIQKGWFTGAIVSELKYELSVLRRSEYRQTVTYMQLIEKILKSSQQETRGQDFTRLPAESKEGFRQLLDAGRLERRRMRWKLRDFFNPNFGSVFRTEKNPTLFATKIKAFANVYTADLSNLGAYPSDFIFYPKRMTQAHETRMPEVDDLLDEIQADLDK
ncbi:hypothetical protein H4S06_002174 [Coemansia sp. BCRC 34490]|nr:hypothetical protein H4S06_002174 [Coemansia sp. BCRC 34490]